MIIDSHQHFWKYNPTEYVFNDKEAALRHDFLPNDLAREIAKAGVDAVVSVQARQSLAETEWLLELAEKNPMICAVVGWLPLVAVDLMMHLERLTKNPKLKAARHVVQDEPDDRFLEDRRFNAGFAALVKFGLTYDILIYDRHLPQSIEFVDRHPNQQFVLDHLAKPQVAKKTMEPWKAQIRELARRDNVMCKVSGLATLAGSGDWTLEDIKPYLDAVLDAFSPRRLMFGSDWPVCLLATDYTRWHETISRWAEPLSSDERAWLFGKTAMKAYRIEDKRN